MSRKPRERSRGSRASTRAPVSGSPETIAVVKSQKKLIPNLNDPTFACVDMTDPGVPVLREVPGQQGNRVKVTIVAPYSP